jgi:hypothetical protein
VDRRLWSSLIRPHLSPLMHDTFACFSPLVVLQGKSIWDCAQEHVQSFFEGLQGE